MLHAHDVWPVRMLPLVLYAMAGVNPVQLGHVVPTGATEYVPAAQVAHTVLAAAVQVDERFWPGWQTVQAVQAPAPAAVEYVLPATQLTHARFAVAVHGEA